MMQPSIEQQNDLLQAALSEVLKSNGNRIILRLSEMNDETSQLLFDWSNDLTTVTITRIAEKSKVVN